jgi:diguanylate cyclase (GGDEF)-like protein/PAS domain S-box-containing protein
VVDASSSPRDDLTADVALQARVLAGLHITGATLALGWLALPHSPGASVAGVVGCIAYAYAVGALLLLRAERMHGLAIRLILGFTTAVVITAAIYFSDTQRSAFALFYLWATLYVSYFFSLREALVLFGLVAASYGALILAVPAHGQSGEQAAFWGLIMGTALVSGSLVRILTAGFRSSEHRYRAVFEKNPGAMWIYDPDSLRFLAVNGAAVRRYGYTREEFLAMTLRDIRPAEDVGALEAALKGGDPERRRGGLWRHSKKDGSIIDVEILADEVLFAGRPARLVLANDVTERLRTQEQLRYHAEHDALTGLLNRRRFEEEVARGVESSAHTGTACAVLVADVDHLKYVNDSFGHAAGDDLLRRVGGLLGQCLPEEHTLARIGGDEFAALLPGMDEAAAAGVARATVDFFRADGAHRPRHSTLSIGVAASTPEVRPSADELLVAADLAMYDAKDAGRDRFVVSRGPRGGMTWVDEIRAAIDENRLELHSQPILNLKTGAIAQEELLVRMRSRDGDLIPPGAFIPTAERFGLINEIDRWVVGQGVQLARDGRCIEVNVSAHSLGDRELTRLVAGGVSAGAPAENIVLEITETAAAANYDEAREFAERLGRLGCGFALDDFGTGFGSFSYLKHVPVGYLKIDMEFVRNIAHDTTDQRVVQAIVSIAKGFGQKTIAEGVEDSAALEFLRAYDVDFAQGYAIGRPEPLKRRVILDPEAQPAPAPVPTS